MPKNPAIFKQWLSGRCLYSDPPSWVCEVATNRLAVVPTWRTTLISLLFLLFFFSFAGFVFWVSHGDHSIFGVVGMVFGIALGILAIAAFGTMTVTYLADHFKGPYLIYSVVYRNISLPREAIDVPIAEVLGWRLVSGNWIGPDGAQKMKSNPMSEVQLIIRTPEGPMAYAVVGGKVNSITAQAREIARATGMPLELVEQHQGISSPDPSTRVKWWRTRGM